MMSENDKELIDTFKKNILFSGLSEEQLYEFIPSIDQSLYDAGDTIIEEGEVVNGIYIIKNGSVEVIKHGMDAALTRLTTLHAGESFGEMTILDQGPRSATIRAIVPTEVVFLSLDSLEALRSKGISTYSTIMTNLSKALNMRLRLTSDATISAIQGQVTQTKANETLQIELEQANNRNKVAVCFCAAVGLLALYSFIIASIINVAELFSTTISIVIPLTIVFCYLLIYGVSKYVKQLSGIGLTLKRVNQSLTESMLMTIPIIVYVTIVKWLLVWVVPNSVGSKLFQLPTEAKMASFGFDSMTLFIVVVILLYGIFAFFQELFARGVMLTSLEKIFSGTYRHGLSIVVSSLIFLVIYTHGSLYAVALMFVPYLVWGILYLRHRSLLGVTLSHIIVGSWVYLILGVDYAIHFMVYTAP